DRVGAVVGVVRGGGDDDGRAGLEAAGVDAVLRRRDAGAGVGGGEGDGDVGGLRVGRCVVERGRGGVVDADAGERVGGPRVAGVVGRDGVQVVETVRDGGRVERRVGRVPVVLVCRRVLVADDCDAGAGVAGGRAE